MSEETNVSRELTQVVNIFTVTTLSLMQQVHAIAEGLQITSPETVATIRSKEVIAKARDLTVEQFLSAISNAAQAAQTTGPHLTPLLDELRKAVEEYGADGQAKS